MTERAVRAAAPPSGQQHQLVFADQQATVVEVGGGIREYVHGDVPVLDPYAIDAMCDGAHGTPLIPWPNRLADGRYRFGGVDHQVALTEPAKGNAIHGLLRWARWTATRHGADGVTMAATVFPQPGYPFHLEIAVAYQLDGNGLTVTTTATNVGGQPAPYGCGQHPYLSAGAGTVDTCELELAGATRIVVDDRGLPIDREAVAGTPYDFRSRRPIGALEVDSAFTDLDRDGAGRARARLWRPDGTCAELWVEAAHPIIQIFTGDTLSPTRRRRGLGAEPMTCPPNALQTGEGVIALSPDAAVTTRWGVRLGA
ncbi:MAG: aldose 1-epimerase family protein [Acidimicrobiales bacterium]